MFNGGEVEIGQTTSLAVWILEDIFTETFLQMPRAAGEHIGPHGHHAGDPWPRSHGCVASDSKLLNPIHMYIRTYVHT